MAHSIEIVDERELGYSRQRMKNRVFAQLVKFFEEEAAHRRITKKDLAFALNKDAGQLNRILNYPSNLTLETISDILVALDAEMDTRIVRFADRSPTNYMHPLMAKIQGQAELRPLVQNQPTTANTSKFSTFKTVMVVENA